MNRCATRHAASDYTEESEKIHILMHRYLLDAPQGTTVAHAFPLALLAVTWRGHSHVKEAAPQSIRTPASR